MRRLRKWLVLLGSSILLALTVFVVWASAPLGPMEEAMTAIQSDDLVSVAKNGWYLFKPAGGTPTVGLILYPGGRVDPRSYAPLAREISAAGFVTAITPMPLNLAVFAPGRALEVIDSMPSVSSWAVGGHSLGGAMAAEFAFRNPDKVRGLVLLAAYPASGTDLSAHDLRALSIYGTLDGVAELGTLEASRALLPADTIWLSIDGGNHAQFGWYGDQPGDQPAAIPRDAQQSQAVIAIVEFLGTIGAGSQ